MPTGPPDRPGAGDVFRFAQTRPRLTIDERWNLLAHLLRIEELYAQAAVHLKSTLFTEPDEPHLRLAWNAARAVEEALDRSRLFGSRLRAWSLVSEKAKALLAQSPADLPGDFYDQCFAVGGPAPGLLAWIYAGVTPEELDLEHGRALLQQFLEERWVQDPVRALWATSGGATLVELPLLMAELGDRRAAVAQLGVSPVREAVPAGWQPERIVKRKTNIPFLDQVLGGGQVDGETHAVLGGFGAGKSILAVQITAEVARMERRCFDKHLQEGPLRYSYLFHYEAGLNEMRCRLVSYVAKIDRDAVFAYPHQSFSRAGALREYEKILFAYRFKDLRPEEVWGEQERFDAYVPQANRNIRLMDMSGPPENPRQGSGGVDEIAMALERERREGRLPCNVVIDYAGLCVRRHVLENRLDDRQFYTLLTNFGYDCLRKIAAPFHTPVWVMHQLSGEANQRGWGARQGMADAQGSKSFAENFWYSFQLGMPNREFAAMRLFCDKARRSDAGPSQLVYLQRPISAMRLADHLTDASGHLELRPGAGAPANGTHPAAAAPPARPAVAPSTNGATAPPRAASELPLRGDGL